MQRTFIKYQAKKLINTGESITKALCKHIIHEGIKQQIWDKEFDRSDGTRSSSPVILNCPMRTYANKKSSIEVNKDC